MALVGPHGVLARADLEQAFQELKHAYEDGKITGLVWTRSHASGGASTAEGAE